jgi:tetratricopeptide (TPR) repeat protein
MARVGDVEGARRLVRTIPDSYEQQLAMAELGAIVAEAGDVEQARTIIGEGIDACRRTQNDFRTDNALAHLIAALARIGDVEAAKAFLAELPDRFSDRSLAIAEIVLVLALKGQLSSAIELLPGLDKRRSDGEIDKIALKVAEHGNGAGALQLAQQIPDPVWASLTKGKIARSVMKQGIGSEAVRMASDIETTWVRIETQASVAEMLAGKSGDEARILMLKAEENLKSLSEPYWQVRCRTSIGRAWKRLGDPPRALKRIQEAHDLLGKFPEGPERSRAADLLSDAYAAAGNIEKAIELGAPAGVVGQEHVLERIALVLAESGDAEGTLNILGRCADKCIRATILVSLAERCSKKEEQRELVRKAFGEAVDLDLRGYKSTPNPNAEAVGRIFALQLRLGNVDDALATARHSGKKLGIDAWEPFLRKVAQKEGEDGSLDHALGWIKAIDNPLAKGMACLGLAEGLSKRSKK